MATWAEFTQAAGLLGQIGSKLFSRDGVVLLATVRKDGAPRVHPICPIITHGQLFVIGPPALPGQVGLGLYEGITLEDARVPASRL